VKVAKDGTSVISESPAESCFRLEAAHGNGNSGSRMSSKRAIRRTMLRKQCTGKRRYGSLVAAAIAKSKRKEKFAYNAYRCRFCGFYHLGHRPFRFQGF
jgi:hypothetical protein